MFNLIMQVGAWEPDEDIFPRDRIFEHTEERLLKIYDGKVQPDFEKLKEMPCLFMQEGKDDQIARVGRIVTIRNTTNEVHLHYVIEAGIPALTNRDIVEARMEFGISVEREFYRTHWAVKDADLYRAILRTNRSVARSKPKVFTITDREKINVGQTSVMMPFDASQRPVYDDIKSMCQSIGMTCKRGDDIWNNDAIIQDVVDLIDKSRIVICDCTGKNANVFYEAGIAHTLGRDVILITQNHDDVPFDLRHLRYVHYLNNREGREQLCERLKTRIANLVL